MILYLSVPARTSSRVTQPSSKLMSWKKKPFVGKRTGQLVSPLCYTPLVCRDDDDSSARTIRQQCWASPIYNTYNIIYYICGLFLPFVLVAADAFVLYIICVYVCSIISNYKRKYWISLDATETHLTNFSSRPHDVHPTHLSSFIGFCHRSFVNRPS